MEQLKDERASVERMELQFKHSNVSNAVKQGWATTIAVVVIIAIVAAIVLGLNAAMPPAW